jgi:hypothetical protein
MQNASFHVDFHATGRLPLKLMAECSEPSTIGFSTTGTDYLSNCDGSAFDVEIVLPNLGLVPDSISFSLLGRDCYVRLLRLAYELGY